MRGLGALRTACIISVVCISTAMVSVAKATYTTLLVFDGVTANGTYYMSLVQGFDGNFYGTTAFGGTNGEGAVFQLTPSGVLTDLYSFCSQTNCTDGDRPYGGLALGADGNFYGSTYEGGGSANCPAGCGTIFQITPSGTLTTLYSFSASDGAYPYGNLLLASDGNFYGATAEVSDFGPVGNGTIFKITTGGTLTTLHTFSGTDGSYPYGPLVQAPNGTLYGTTNGGSCPASCGTVFAMTPAGLLTTLHTFSGTDGCYPYGGMALVGTVLYGTASQCGTNNVGTVFKITTTGTLTTLYTFSGPDGSYPDGSLIQATNGKLYGTTESGGSDPSCFQPTNCSGTVFQITPTGALTTLHAFNGTGGGTLFSGVAEATNGVLYGTTQSSAFSVGIGLAPFVEALPSSGPVGANVNILGTNLAGVTGVSFGGAAATFTVVSPTLITATVPDGATTAKIGVTTPGQSSAISGCAWVGGTATCILASTAGFEIGYPLTIAGVTPAKYNIAKATVSGISSNQISYALPANPGVYKSGGTASEPSATLSSNVAFEVLPQILGFNPTSGVRGTPVVITGVSLGQTTKVLFGAKTAKFTIDSDTQVTATAPKLLAPTPITIITKGGTATSATSFAP